MILGDTDHKNDKISPNIGLLISEKVSFKTYHHNVRFGVRLSIPHSAVFLESSIDFAAL